MTAPATTVATITATAELRKDAKKAPPVTNTTNHGMELLQNSSLNKSTGFTEAEKQALGLVGLVPDVTETEDLQLDRVMLMTFSAPGRSDPSTLGSLDVIAIKQMVAEPDRVKTHLLAQARHRGHFRPADFALDLGQLEADLERARGD